MKTCAMLQKARDRIQNEQKVNITVWLVPTVPGFSRDILRLAGVPSIAIASGGLANN